MRQLIRFVVFVLLVAIRLAAQDKPDFSGRWVLADSAQPGPDSPRALSVRQLLVQATVAGAIVKPFYREIAIDREFENSTRSETYSIGTTGGVVPGHREDGRADGPTKLHAVKWEGSALVFETGTYTGEIPGKRVWSERREVWSLDPDGRLRLTIAIRSSEDVPRTLALIYRRP